MFEFSFSLYVLTVNGVFIERVVNAMELLDAELKHRLNTAAANAMHNRMLIVVAHCCGQSAVISSVLVIY